MNTLPPASVPSPAASSQALSASSGTSSSNPSDRASVKGASTDSSASGNFHQVLNQQIAQHNGASNDGNASAAPVAPAAGSAVSSKSSKTSHSAIPQAAVPGSASQASDLSAQQAAAIGLAAAQSAQAAPSADAADPTDLPDHAAAAKAPAGGAPLSSQQSQVAVNTNAALAAESDGEDNIAAGDTGKQVAGTDDSSGGAMVARGWVAIDDGNQQRMLTSMGGKGDRDGSDLSDGAGGTGASQSNATGTAYLVAEHSAMAFKQSFLSDARDKTHLASELTTAGSGDATLAAAQVSTIQLPAASQSSAGTTVASASVPYQMGSDAWRADVSSHVLYFSQQDISSAQLHLNPAHLSPLDISISVDNNQTSIAFNAAHEATRQAMQDSLPQLREMFGAHGIALGQTTVGDSSAGSAQQQNQGKAQSGSGNASLASKALESSSTAGNGISGARIRSLQIVDTFA